MCWKTFSITTKTSFSFGGLNKNSPPSVLLSWHTTTCVRKMLDGRYWREMSCPYMAKEPSPISDSLETRDPGRFFWNFPESSEYLGITLPKTIMQVTKNAGLEDDSKLSKVGIFYDFPCFFVRGLYVSTVETFHRGGQPLNTWKFSGLYITQPWRPPHCHQWGNLRWKDGEIIIMAF